ncbi:MAG: aldolase/citrate lyase family protein [Lentisphaeria bacterium]|nr:aldolase/citrate lyase family protein [Lentisphaeria bacterium]
MNLAMQLRQHVAAGEAVCGTFLNELRSPWVPVILGNAGFDYVIIDEEHGRFTVSDTAGLIVGATRVGLCPLVRVPLSEPAGMSRTLDAGAQGVVIPMIRTLDDARLVVECTKYPPLGLRGLHTTSPHTSFSRPADVKQYAQECNDSLLTILQVETAEALAIVDDLAAVDGVDALLLGPNDMSVALGLIGQPEHERVFEAAAAIVEACRKSGKLAAAQSGDVATARRFRELGMHLVSAGSPVGFLAKQAGAVADGIKESL